MASFVLLTFLATIRIGSSELENKKYKPTCRSVVIEDKEKGHEAGFLNPNPFDVGVYEFPLDVCWYAMKINNIPISMRVECNQYDGLQIAKWENSPNCVGKPDIVTPVNENHLPKNKVRRIIGNGCKLKKKCKYLRTMIFKNLPCDGKTREPPTVKQIFITEKHKIQIRSIQLVSLLTVVPSCSSNLEYPIHKGLEVSVKAPNEEVWIRETCEVIQFENKIEINIEYFGRHCKNARLSQTRKTKTFLGIQKCLHENLNLGIECVDENVSKVASIQKSRRKFTSSQTSKLYFVFGVVGAVMFALLGCWAYTRHKNKALKGFVEVEGEETAPDGHTANPEHLYKYGYSDDDEEAMQAQLNVAQEEETALINNVDVVNAEDYVAMPEDVEKESHMANVEQKELDNEVGDENIADDDEHNETPLKEKNDPASEELDKRGGI